MWFERKDGKLVNLSFAVHIDKVEQRDKLSKQATGKWVIVAYFPHKDEKRNLEHRIMTLTEKIGEIEAGQIMSDIADELKAFTYKDE